jgi:hypothetical protein
MVRMWILIGVVVALLGLEIISIILTKKARKENDVGTAIICFVLSFAIVVILLLITYQWITGKIYLPGIGA